MNLPTFPDTLPLSEPVFSVLADLIHRRTGLAYDAGKRDLLATKLSPLVIERNLDDFLDYYYLLKYDAASEDEWRRVQAALAVNETFFWREPAQLEAVAARLVPEMAPHRSIRIWHAGCCTGEEPYSMAIALKEHQRSRFDIVATDANATSIQAAEAAVYRPRSLRALSEPLRAAYFTPLDGLWALRDDIRKSVTFRCSNLVDPAAVEILGGRDIIFCRNVFIYFSTAAMLQVVKGFHEILSPGGYLFLAASESLLRYNTPFEFVELGGAIGYRKPGP